MTFRFPERAPARPIWLVTLADLALLLVGFFVLLQAHATDGRSLAGALRNRFGSDRVEDVTAAAAVRPASRAMPVAAAAVEGFAPGSAVLPHSPRALLDWAGEVARDPRTTLTVTGLVDGSAADVDPATGSGAVLAADRARALAAALAPVLATNRPQSTIRAPFRPLPSRLQIATATTPGRRAATVTIGFTGTQP